jgi:hypothetical protein
MVVITMHLTELLPLTADTVVNCGGLFHAIRCVRRWWN